MILPRNFRDESDPTRRFDLFQRVITERAVQDNITHVVGEVFWNDEAQNQDSAKAHRNRGWIDSGITVVTQEKAPELDGKDISWRLFYYDMKSA